MEKPANTRSLRIAVQFACGVGAVPRAAQLRRWAQAAATTVGAAGVVCIRVVSEAEMAELNRRFRQRAGATNVLSFDGDVLPDGTRQLGDVVICADLVRREASEQGKRAADHFCHLVVHGILHLCGYDHDRAREARVMEAHETAILADLGIADPYRRSGTGGAHE
jgi:probable rRNA maturation factor